MSDHDCNKVPSEDVNAVMLQNVMKATGLPQDIVEGFLMTASDPEKLCDAAFFELATPPEKIAT